MNNRIQQRFDRSIREAVRIGSAAVEQERSAKRRDVKPHTSADTKLRAQNLARRKSKGRLYLDPETGATVWDPNG